MSVIDKDLKVVLEAMTQAYLDRASPDGGYATALEYAKDRIIDMHPALIIAWSDYVNCGDQIKYDADNGDFFLAEGEDE